MLFCWRLALTMIKSAIRVIVSLKVTLAMCGSLASTVSDSENDDDAFVGPIASWFVLIDDRLQNQTDSKHHGLHKASSIYKCNLTVSLRDDFVAQSSPIGLYRRVYASAGARKSVSRPKKHTLTQQLSMFMKYISMSLT